MRSCVSNASCTSRSAICGVSSVYNNMEQILDKKTWTDNHPFHLSDRTYEKHMLPQTDDILDRAVNISIGVVDKGLGSGCGININSTEEEINATAKHIREVIAGL